MELDAIRQLRRDGRDEEACSALIALAAERTDDAVIQYEAACVHDWLGHERAAVGYYEVALALGLPDALARSAYLGLGSTYRALGEYEASRQVLQVGLARFIDAPELRTFLAMTLYNLHEANAAVSMLLGVVADTSSDADLSLYKRAIRLYAQDLDRCWD